MWLYLGVCVYVVLNCCCCCFSVCCCLEVVVVACVFIVITICCCRCNFCCSVIFHCCYFFNVVVIFVVLIFRRSAAAVFTFRLLHIVFGVFICFCCYYYFCLLISYATVQSSTSIRFFFISYTSDFCFFVLLKTLFYEWYSVVAFTLFILLLKYYSIHSVFFLLFFSLYFFCFSFIYILIFLCVFCILFQVVLWNCRNYWIGLYWVLVVSSFEIVLSLNFSRIHSFCICFLLLVFRLFESFHIVWFFLGKSSILRCSFEFILR